MRTACGRRVVVSLAVGTSDLQSMTAKQGLPEGDKLEEFGRIGNDGWLVSILGKFR